MNLVPVVEFKTLAAQLTDMETKSFLSHLVASDPQLIVRSLSSLFIHQLATSNNESPNAQYNRTISNIIQSRDNQQAIESDAKLDKLPMRLIGVCASFLDQKSFTDLAKCNSSLYLGCNKPNALREINASVDVQPGQQSLDFSSFVSAQKLTLKRNAQFIGIERMNLIASQMAKMSRLQILDVYRLSTEFMQIIASHEATNQRTRSLCVRYSHSSQDIVTSITAFKDIEFLRVRMKTKAKGGFSWGNIPVCRATASNNNSAFKASSSTSLRGGFSGCKNNSSNSNEPSFSWGNTEWQHNDVLIKALIESCRNLKGLDFDGMAVVFSSVLQEIGPELHYLRLDTPVGLDLKKIKFSALRQLVQGRQRCNNGDVKAILETAANLEKVSVSKNSVPASSFKKDDKSSVSQLIANIFEKCDKLEYLEIHDHQTGVIQHMLSAVEVGISKLRYGGQTKKQKLKIKFDYPSVWSIGNSDEYVIRVLRIIKSLCTKVHHWMVLLPAICNEHLHKALVKETTTNQLKAQIYEDIDNGVIVRSNTGCNINGYRESWLM